MATYTVALTGWQGEYAVTIEADNESEATYKALTDDGAPWASVIEIERES